MSEKTRTEKDPLGALEVPADALYGIEPLRAVQNFPISGLRPLPAFIDATVHIKRAAALTHKETGRLEPRLADAIVKAAGGVLAGKHREQFVVDVYQAGAGTSHNMNCNEVLANRANEILAHARGVYAPVHPNDHVNMAQSTNDVIPTAIRLGCLMELHAYAGSLRRGLKRVVDAADYLRDLGIGGSAVGTGVNVEREYPKLMVKHLRESAKVELREGKDRIQLMQSMGDVAGFSSQLRVLALDLSKIASDLRLLASGPRTGLDEIRLPSVQPGSSIMPGKVNPSIPEMENQVCFQVIGNDACVSIASEHGQLELNVMMPVIAHNVLFSMMILRNSARVFAEKTVKGIEANEEQCRYWLERCAAPATALAPQIGYARAAELSKQSVKENVLIRDLVKREKVLPAKEIEEVLDLRKMTEIGVPGGKHGGVAGG